MRSEPVGFRGSDHGLAEPARRLRPSVSMMRVLRALLGDEDGQDLAEYAIALAIIALGTAMLAAAIGTDVQTLWSNAQPAIKTVVDSE